MKIILTNWCRSQQSQEPPELNPVVLSLENEKILAYLIVSIGNGNFDETCIEVDSTEAYQYIRELAYTSGATRIEVNAKISKSELFRPRYEIYIQGQHAYFFLNPVPRPELFLRHDLDDYMKEFSSKQHLAVVG